MGPGPGLGEGEEITETGYGRDLFVVDRIRNVFYGTQKKIERTDYAFGG